MKRLHQALLILYTLLASWLGMQAVHESGHVVGAWLSGGEVAQVVLHPLTISRTDLGRNPSPLVVVWLGPVVGALLPLLLWLCARGLRLRGSFVLRFFAGFCLIANGAYIGVGSFNGIGDCGEMLRHGSEMWQLWLFGGVAVPAGLAPWHGLGPDFGLGSANGRVDRGVAYGAGLVLVLLLTLAFVVDGN